METVNIYEAKTHLSKLIDRAAAGEDVVIARAGRPVARLTRLDEPQKRRIRYGVLAGRIRIPEDFDDPLPREITERFEGR